MAAMSLKGLSRGPFNSSAFGSMLRFSRPLTSFSSWTLPAILLAAILIGYDGVHRLEMDPSSVIWSRCSVPLRGRGAPALQA